MAENNQYTQNFSWRYLLPNYWVTWFGFFLLWMLSFLSFKKKRYLSKLLAKNIYKNNTKRRNIVETNFSLAFPNLNEKKRQQMALDFITNAVFIFLDYPLLLWASKKTLDKRIKFKGFEHIQTYQNENKPIIFLTCHMLALEYGALALTKRIETVGLIKPARNKLFEWLITRGRIRFLGKIYLRDKGIRPIVRAIKNNKAFYYLPDEDLGEKVDTQFVPFFGVETATLTALAPMAKMTKAAVLPAVTILDEKTGCYTLEVKEALSHFPGNNETEDMLRMNQVIEQLIEQAPTQYMWSLRLFQTRPDGAPSPYKF